jgi:excisionase family DNA binding protein
MTTALTTRGSDIVDRERLLSPAELGDFLGIPVATLYRWRYHSTGPRGCRVGRHVRYRMSDVQKWLDEQSLP